MPVSLRFVVVGSLLAVGPACGLRSDPEGVLFCGETAEDTDGEVRAGSCESPIPVPGGNLVVRGTLTGCSMSRGWCGADDGPDDVFVLSPPAAQDVTISIRPEETTFPATIRVSYGDDACEPSAADTDVCGPADPERTAWSFRVNEAGVPVYVTVDSATYSSDMEYAFDIFYGGQFVDSEQGCQLHPEVITLGTGGAFVWEDTLARGQGYIDGACGAPGSEHIFELTLKNAGILDVLVEPLDGELAPVISLRTRCASNTEAGCSAAGQAGLSAALSQPVEPGKMWLAVDQSSVKGGAYRLTASM